MSSKRWVVMIVVAAAALWGVHEMREQTDLARARTEEEPTSPTGAASAAKRTPTAKSDSVLQGKAGLEARRTGLAAPVSVALDKTTPVAGSAKQAVSPGELFDRAAVLTAKGKRGAAAQLLRQVLEESTDAKTGARAALRLAPLVSDAPEQRRLWGRAVRDGGATGADYDAVNAGLAALNRASSTSLLPLIETHSYEVQPGDSLWKLCHKVFPERFGVSTEVGLIQLVNGLSSTVLHVGQNLVVPAQPIAIRVDAQGHGLTAWLNDQLLAAYQVGLGKEGRTPRGAFVVKVKQENPAWFQQGKMIPFGDPDNVLGTRWLGFEDQPGARGFGIHGTSDPGSVGGDVSMGCVRMRNEEVERLFSLVPRGTQVLIQ